MLNKINSYSGILTLLSVICALVFHFTSITMGVEQVEKNISKQHETLQIIKESLINKTRDHSEFLRSSEKTSKILSDMTIVLAKLEITLNALDRKIK